MKTRFLLCLYFLAHALLALVDPRRGLEIVTLEKKADEALRKYNMARVGDKL
jgi:hypothetical protein